MSVTEPPSQKVVGPLALIAAEGDGLTVTGVDADDEQPLALVIVTLYVPDAETAIDCELEPFDHEYE